MREPSKRGDAEISLRTLRKDWNLASPKRASCPEGGEWRGFGGEHKEITQAIIGAAIRIPSTLGPGLLEDAYRLCLAHALRTSGHKVLREVYLDIEGGDFSLKEPIGWISLSLTGWWWRPKCTAPR